MNPREASELLSSINETAQINISIVINDLDLYADAEIENLKEMGYASFLRHTAVGNEVVVTDKVNHEKTGSARP